MGDGDNIDDAAPLEEGQDAPAESAQEQPEQKSSKRSGKGSGDKGKRGKKKAAIDLSKVAAVGGGDAESTGADDEAGPGDDDAPPADAADVEDESPSQDGDGEPSDVVAPTEDDDEEGEGEGEGEEAKPGKKRSKKPPEPIDPSLKAVVEAIIFAADDPVTPAAIAKAIGDVKPSVVKRAIDELCREREMSGISIVEVAGGWTMLTREEYAPAIRRLRKATESRKLTAAALETLAVIAYKQPIQKQEIEDIRGVSCGPILRTLMERSLVKIAGRAEALGRPLLYGTTKRFLDVFGIPSLKDLPKISELSQS